MLKNISACSFIDNISIYSSAVLNKVNRIFNAATIYDDSVMRLAKKHGDFDLIKSSHSTLLFSFSSYKFYIRKRTSDSEVFKQVFLNQEYKMLVDLLKGTEVKTIIDAGANAGYTSLFFNKSFPSANIYSIEPSYTNIEILRKNVEINNLENCIHVLPYGLWSSNTILAKTNDFRDNKDWSHRVASDLNGNIEGRTLSSLLTENNITKIDILKVDIEGAEQELFAEPEISSILNITKSIAIETHAEIGFKNLLSINERLINAGFIMFTIGECTFGINKNLNV